MAPVLNFLCAALYLLINVVFVIKYSAEVTSHNYSLAAGYAALVIVVLAAARRVPARFFSRKLFFALTALYTGFWIVLLAWVPVESITLDRYEMIRLFWDNFFAGRNPYTPRVPGSNIPGPFPMYFYLALPFHLAGEIGYFSLAGVLVFAYLLRNHIRSEQDRIILLVALLLSPAVAYGILCRSTLFVNSVLVLLYVLTVSGMQPDTGWKEGISAFFAGLLLSTRSIVLVVLLPFLVFLGVQRAGWRRIVLWGAWAAAGCAASFLPVIFFPGFFPDNNPVAVQSIFLPSWIPALVLLTMCLLASRYRSIHSLIAASGLAIFALSAIHILLVIHEYGYQPAIFHDGADISYLNLALPFVFFAMAGPAAVRP